MIFKCPTSGDEERKMIKVRLFAILREFAKRDELLLEWPKATSCEGVLSYLEKEYKIPESVLTRCLVAINGEYAERDSWLSAGDELAVLPPVSGG